jgi:hypothetical protein
LFVTHDEFQKMIASNALIEWQNVHHDDLYGMPRATVEDAVVQGEDLIADIEVLGATYLRSVYPDNVILIFIAPPSNSRRALLNNRVESGLPRRRMAFAGSAIPSQGNEVLRSASYPHFPAALLAHGELPHEAALRALSQVLKPITPTVPTGWAWVPRTDIAGYM